jgi:hypothetical protein
MGSGLSNFYKFNFYLESVPTFVILYKGYERGRTSGALPEADFALWVASKI